MQQALASSFSAFQVGALTLALGLSVSASTIMVDTPIRMSSADFPWIPATLVVLFLVGEILVRRPQVRQRIAELQSSLAPSDTSDRCLHRLFLMVFLLAAVLLAAGGILIVLRLRSYSVALDATSFQYAALAAVFVGGSSLFSERITFIGSLVGVLIVTMMSNVLLLLGYASYWGTLLTSALLLVALVLDFLTTPRPQVVRVAEGTVSRRKRATAS